VRYWLFGPQCAAGALWRVAHLVESNRLMSSWPLVSDFSRMLQNPKVAFRDPALRDCVVEKDNLGQPKPRSGNFATVYRGYKGDGTEFAIRVFNRAADERKERYQTLSQYVDRRKVPWLVDFTFDERGIRSASDGKLYPLVTMDWVPGITLIEWVRDRCRENYREALLIGAEVWQQLVRELAEHDIVHGDLQHGNVMVTPEGHFKLVDYDCMGVPALMGRRNLEIGLEPYQHPGRDFETKLFPGLDKFSALVIYVALRALAAAPNLWATYVDGPGYDKLLFRKSDFENPAASPLYHELLMSPDEQVRDLTHYLFQLTHYDLHNLPTVDEVLLWCNSIEDLLAQKEWEKAVQLAQYLGEDEPLSPQIQPLLAQAQRRVECKRRLEKALDGGNEREIQKAYEPELLDDWPAVAPLVEQAKQAAEVIRVLEVLSAARKLNGWKVYRDTWRAYQGLLANRPSAKPYAAEMKRLLTADGLSKLIADPRSSDQAIIDAWRYLESLGGHPSAKHLEGEVKRRIARLEGAARLEQLVAQAPPRPTAEHDTELVEAGRRESGEDTPLPAHLKPAFEAAQKRLRGLERIGELAKERTADSEKEIIAIAKSLPEGYFDKHRERVKQASRRLRACRDIQKAMALSNPDPALAEAYQSLKAADGVELLPDELRERAELAARRAPLLKDLEELSANPPTPELDRRIVKDWDETLLAEAPQAEAWRRGYESARGRLAALEELEALIEQGEAEEVAERLGHAPLKGYRLPAKLNDRLAELREAAGKARRRRREELLIALRESDSDLFVKEFDAELVAEICKTAPHHERLAGQWTEELILPLEELGLRVSEGQGIELRGQSFYAAWTWPSPRRVDRCHLAICREPPRATAGPHSVEPLYDRTIDRDAWSAAGGAVKLPHDPEWGEATVVVWAVVDIGFQEFFSRPQVIGQLKPPKKQRRWSIFGAGRAK